MFTLRPPHPPDDYGPMAELFSLTGSEPVTATSLERRRAQLAANGLLYEQLAVHPSGQMIGCASAYRWNWSAPGKFYVNVAVSPAARRQGVGAALLAACETFTLRHGTTKLVGEVLDHDQATLDYLQKRGWLITRRFFDSELNLRSLDPGRFAGVIPAVTAGGIRLFTLADQPGPATEQALYELMSRTMWDIPGVEGQHFMPFDTWHAYFVAAEGSRPDWIFIAADGERPVGIGIMISQPDGKLYTPHTSVDRAYRGRGIALALKVMGTLAALEHGAPAIRTGNDSTNAPMLAVNRKLGYVSESGAYEVVKPIQP